MAIDKSTKKIYKCGCGNEFPARADYVSGGGRHGLSNQIKCPNCLNFVPTWEKVKVGNKHIHRGR